jgi:Tol biopolymer transport system component
MDDDHRLWLVDLADGSERQLAEGTDLSWLYLWGDAHTLLLGVFLSASENEGPSIGHVATLDIDSSELRVIDEDYLSHGRPAMAPDGQSVAYDISAFSADVINGRIYHQDSGSQPLDPALFDGLEGERPCNLYNPAWSPDGRQVAWLCGAEAGSRLVVFDLVRQTAITVFTWRPAQFGALPPSPVWSIDGKWLAIEIWANNEDESGLWVLPADGTLARLHIPTGREPIWLNSSQLLYADVDENMNGDIKLFDLDYNRQRGVLDLPAGGTVLLTPPYR